MEYYSAARKDGILPFTITWPLCKASKPEKDKCGIAYIYIYDGLSKQNNDTPDTDNQTCFWGLCKYFFSLHL